MKNKQRKILVIDDSKANLLLLKVHLEKMGLNSLLIDNSLEGIRIAIDQQPDMILLDVMLPDIDGFEVCKRLKTDSRTSKIPVIFVSARTQAVDKIAGLEIGAIDYITKPFDRGELKARIDIVLNMLDLQDELLNLANTDALTKLANRRSFFEILDQRLLDAKLKRDNFSLAMIDIDHFKLINDTYGHQAGDEILKQMGTLLCENTYTQDFAARYGGEEFAILMTGLTPKQVTSSAERICCLIKQNQWKIFDKQIKISASIGIASMDFDYSFDSHDLIRRADMALYAAKHQGRNCVVYWDQIEESAFTETMAKMQNFYMNDHIGKFISSTQQALYSIADAIEADRPHDIIQNALILRNSAYQIKAKSLVDIARRLLFAAQQQEKHLFVLLFEELKCEFDRLKIHLSDENATTCQAITDQTMTFTDTF